MDSFIHNLPFLSKTAGIGGVLRSTPEDFEVEEIPKYQPSGEGDHTYLWIEKRNVSTFEAIKILANAFGVRRADIGTAGLKDKRAVTRQWISLPATKSPVPETVEGIDILERSRHKNKLKTGHLIGNRFRIVIRDVDAENAVVAANEAVGLMWERGIPNYFGPQRFGHDGRTFRDGVAFLAGEKYIADKRFRRLALSAIQSGVFNAVLRWRMENDYFDAPILGDCLIYRRDLGSRIVTQETMEADIIRLKDREVALSGPMPGPKMLRPETDALAMETAQIDALDVDVDGFSKYAKLTRGTRRPLATHFLEQPTVSIVNKDAIEITFSLPSGSYATIPLQEVMKVQMEPG